MLTKLVPLDEKLVVEIKEADQVSPGGVLLPGNATDKPTEGTVLAVGDSLDMKVKVGDQVMFSKYSGVEVGFEGKDLMVMSQKDILAIIR